MVVRKTIDHLRKRPREERAAAAGWIAVGVAAVLFLGWALFFFNKIHGMTAQTNEQSVPAQPQTANSDTVQWSQVPPGH